MAKNYKIKRYNRIYRGKRSTGSLVLRGALVAAAVFIVAFVGYNAYGPIRDYFSGALAAASHNAPSEAEPAPPPAETSEPEPEPEPPVPADVRALYLTNTQIRDPALLDQLLDELTRTEINAVLFDLKDQQGNILYRSDLDLVAQTGAQSENAYDLGVLCQKLKEKNLIPIGRLNAFRDPIAPSRIPDAGIKYMNTEILWHDNAADQGDMPWLNPYSDLARAYIIDIATESVSLGVGRILLDNVSFPTGYGQEYASYGPTAEGVTRSDALSVFLDQIDQQVQAKGGDVSVYISGLAALGANNTYYGSNPLAIANDNVTIGVMPAQFGDGFTLESFSLEAPVLDPRGTVDSLLKFIAPDVAGKNVTVLVQAYPASYTIENNKMYTVDDINAQIGAASQNGVISYIIYSPDGSYPQPDV